MECILIDFEVLETNNTKKLLIGDSSKWDYAIELPAYIYITMPGSYKEKEFLFPKGGILTLNSVNMGVNCEVTTKCGSIEYVDLPDGVYKIKLQSGFEDIKKEKYYLKTDKLNKEIAKKLVRNMDKGNSKFKEKVFDIWYLLEVSKAYMIEGDVPKTNRYYNEALSAFKCL